MGGKPKIKDKERERFFSDLGREQTWWESRFGIPQPAARGGRRRLTESKRRTAMHLARSALLILLGVAVFVLVRIIVG
jgi:hypothetical protein